MTNAFLAAAEQPACYGRIFNIGGSPPASLQELADIVVRLSGGTGHYVTREFPADRARIDIGSYHADDRAFRSASGWRPQTSLEEGVGRTLDRYRTRLADYPLIPQANPGAGYRALKEEIDQAVGRALSSGWYVLGNDLRAFEVEFAAWLGVPWVVGCGNGTDAIVLALRGLGIGPGFHGCDSFPYCGRDRRRC